MEMKINTNKSIFETFSLRKKDYPYYIYLFEQQNYTSQQLCECRHSLRSKTFLVQTYKNENTSTEWKTKNSKPILQQKSR